MALNLKRMVNAIFRYSPNLLFCWNLCGFQQFFCFCQQVQFLTGPYLDYYNNRRIKAKLKGLLPAIHRQQALSAA